MRGIGLVVLAAVLGGCTSVKMVQRDGCWIRQTKRTFGGAKEDIGPCTRPQPQWSQDRLTRLVQECVAQADYRWQGRALAAWNRREPLPAKPAEETVIETCLTQTATGEVAQRDVQAEALRERLADLSGERDVLRAHAARNDDHLRDTGTKLAEYLGEAAKRPPPVATATATATSDGTATTESGLQSQTGSTSQTLPAATPALAPIVPASAQPATAAPAPVAPPAPQPVADAPAAASATPDACKPAAPTQARTPKRPRPAVRSARAKDGAAPCELPATPTAAKAGELAARPAPDAAPDAAPAPAAAR